MEIDFKKRKKILGSTQEEIVTFYNKKKEKLFGIVHHPAVNTASNTHVGIALLTAGIKNRTAPNRLYVKIARKLALAGFYIFRFDPAGIGDSEGALPDIPTVDLWGLIQKGHFISDTVSAIDFITDHCKLDKLILAGSCGGAITAILTAQNDSRVDKLILIDMPVLISSTKTILEDHKSIIESDENYKNKLSQYYFHSIFRPSSWLRFLAMQSDYTAILSILRLKTKGFFSRSANKPIVDLPNFNKQFAEAFFSFSTSNKNTLFICAEKDTDTQLFLRGFVEKYLPAGNSHEGKYSVELINDANHIYTLTSSQESLTRKILNWLNNEYEEKN